MLRGAGLDVDYEPAITREELLKKIGGYHAVIVRSRTRMDREIIEKADSLRIIVRAGAGLDNIDLEAARAKGVRVESTPEALTQSVAELTIGLILAVLRRIAYADHSMKKGEWIKRQLIGQELKGKVVGVVGAGGRIGLQVSRMLAHGFQAEVIGYDVIDVSGKAVEIGFKPVASLDELLPIADIVTLHVPYLPSTHHLIDRERIERMKDGAILINTSRGRIVDGEALLNAIRKGKIAGAGLDVYHDEPPREGWELELISHPATVCTCHIGAQTVEAQKTAAVLAAELVIRELKNAAPP
ncbi:3-phosphoglycerate dehydrogenase [Candidatus Bathyarchaeota archaeon]|nr:3-phosphoglycerate dehydrogenase [Candidatus Bathyarchaeota archaeon]